MPCWEFVENLFSTFFVVETFYPVWNKTTKIRSHSTSYTFILARLLNIARKILEQNTPLKILEKYIYLPLSL